VFFTLGFDRSASLPNIDFVMLAGHAIAVYIHTHIHTFYKVAPVLKCHAIKTLGAVEVKLHAFLTLALGGSEWHHHAPVTLLLGKEPSVSIK
jgi:hypothetical protein